MLLLCSYFSSQKFPSVWLPLPACQTVVFPGRAAESSIGPADANTMGLLGEKACSHERQALSQQSIAPRRAMDDLRNCICAATPWAASALWRSHAQKEELVLSFCVSYSKPERRVFVCLSVRRDLTFVRLELVFHDPRGTGFPEALRREETRKGK
jgi:hypothetical protein